MKKFTDIRKGDLVRWHTGGILDPQETVAGTAVKFLRGRPGFADVWMCQKKDNTPGCLQPVTPSSFLGFRRVKV